MSDASYSSRFSPSELPSNHLLYGSLSTRSGETLEAHRPSSITLHPSDRAHPLASSCCAFSLAGIPFLRKPCRVRICWTSTATQCHREIWGTKSTLQGRLRKRFLSHTQNYRQVNEACHRLSPSPVPPHRANPSRPDPAGRCPSTLEPANGRARARPRAAARSVTAAPPGGAGHGPRGATARPFSPQRALRRRPAQELKAPHPEAFLGLGLALPSGRRRSGKRASLREAADEGVPPATSPQRPNILLLAARWGPERGRRRRAPTLGERRKRTSAGSVSRRGSVTTRAGRGVAGTRRTPDRGRRDPASAAGRGRGRADRWRRWGRCQPSAQAASGSVRPRSFLSCSGSAVWSGSKKLLS